MYHAEQANAWCACAIQKLSGVSFLKLKLCSELCHGVVVEALRCVLHPRVGGRCGAGRRCRALRRRLFCAMHLCLVCLDTDLCLHQWAAQACHGHAVQWLLRHLQCRPKLLVFGRGKIIEVGGAIIGVGKICDAAYALRSQCLVHCRGTQSSRRMRCNPSSLFSSSCAECGAAPGASAPDCVAMPAMRCGKT